MRLLEEILRHSNTISDYQDFSHRKPNIFDPPAKYFSDMNHNFFQLALLIKPVIRGSVYGALAGYMVSMMDGGDHVGQGLMLGMKIDTVQYSLRMAYDLVTTVFSSESR